MSIAERASHEAEVSAAKTRAWLFPAALAIILFAAIVYIQFSLILGGNGFIAELVLAIGFYYCYAWHNRLAARAKKLEDAPSPRQS